MFIEKILSGNLNISSDAKTLYYEIEQRHPELYNHIVEVNDYIQDKTIRQINTRAALAFKTTNRGCIWFCDPITNEPLLSKSEWIAAATNVEVWAPLALTYPQLTPRLLTGSLSQVVALRLLDPADYELLEKFFSDNYEVLTKHKIILEGKTHYVVFSIHGCPKKKIQKSGIRAIEGVLDAYFYGASELIPIGGSIRWTKVPLEYQIVRNEDDNQSIQKIPEFLQPCFFEN